MAKAAAIKHDISIRFACQCMSVSESCFYYQSKLNAENDQIADWLIRLTENKKRWGFGLCFLYLRNVKGFAWNHKSVYRIYCELELNLRIRPRKRLKRDKRACGSMRSPLRCVNTRNIDQTPNVK